MKTIDIKKWNRREHFEFFNGFDNPFYNISTEVDCSDAYKFSKEKGISFFAFYLYKSIEAVNKIEAFRYRIEEQKVVLHDLIHIAVTIAREDGTFGFSFVPFSENFNQFKHDLKKEIEDVQNSTGLRLNNDDRRTDVIHFSSLPWIKFTGLSHASNFNTDESVPKITFGKAFDRDGKKYLPIAIEVHHGLVDALHIAQFLEAFQEGMED